MILHQMKIVQLPVLHDGIQDMIQQVHGVSQI
jgi:hypothetical protein